MSELGRDEMVVIEILRKGIQSEKTAAIKYLQSVSAKAEADIVNVSGQAQNKIISAIERIKSASLINYDLSGAQKTISSILGKMLSDIELLSKRMITANILLGKVKSILGVATTHDYAISSIMLNADDRSRIDGMLADTMARVKHGADLTMASVTDLIRKAAIRSNMPIPKGESEEKQDKVKQSPMSSEFSGESVEDMKASVAYREKPLTQNELNVIRQSPIAFVNETVRANFNAIRELQTAYRQSVEKNNQLLKSREKSVDKAGTAGRELLNISIEMRKEGVSAFTDKGGKRWSLMNYCSMTARTTSTKSNNVGEVFGDGAHDLYYIVPHGGSCPLCAKIEGKVYSRSGKNPKYPPLASVFAKINPSGSDDLDNTYMIIHPNCRHKIVKYYENKKDGMNKKRLP